MIYDVRVWNDISLLKRNINASCGGGLLCFVNVAVHLDRALARNASLLAAPLLPGCSPNTSTSNQFYLFCAVYSGP